MADYQSAFSMFLATQKDDSIPSAASSDNSRDAINLANASQSNITVPMDLSNSFSQMPSELSTDGSSHFPTCLSTDSLGGDNSYPIGNKLKRHAPPPSEDANLETVLTETHNGDSMDDVQEESVDDTPHFHIGVSSEMLPPSSEPAVVSTESCDMISAEETPLVQTESKEISPSGEKSDQSTEQPDQLTEQPDPLIEQPDKLIEQPVPPTVAAVEEEQPKGSAADRVYEYQWPQETGGDIYMLQEQVSEYLAIVSFKRKYPDLTRRPAEYNERIFLIEKGAVTESLCNLGLTVLRSEEVYDLMSKDYPIKFKEYREAFAERERKRISEQNKGYASMSIEKAKVDFFMKKAIRSAAEFNAHFMREKRDERRAYLDLQTLEVHHPRNKIKVMPKEATDPGTYPVALIPGQFQNYYKKYTPQELKYFPIKTALYSPHKVLKSIFADPKDAEERDTAEEEEGDKDDGSSSSDDSQSGTSESEADSIEPEINEVKISEEQIKKLLAVKRPDTPPKKRRKKAVPVTTDTADSEKDSETGSVKVVSKRLPKTPSRRTPGKAGKGVRPKSSKEGNNMSTEGRPPLPQNQPCNICQEVGQRDKDGTLTEMAQCSECYKYAHIVCLELTDEMIPIIKTYPWQCMECKTCIKCKDSQDEENMMFCDRCDRGYHTFCVGLKAIPPGRWECPSCIPEENPQPADGATAVETAVNPATEPAITPADEPAGKTQTVDVTDTPAGIKT